MAQNSQFEIPPQMRQLAEQNVKQAQSAFHQFIDATRRAQDMMGSMMPATAGLKELQDRALQFTQQNIDASFALMHELAKARSFQDALEIQGRFAQKQIQNYAQQAQELGRLMAEASQKR